MGRVCAVGVDAASIALIDELCDTGHLPNLRALRDRSARARLHSAPGHRHGMLWTQFVTGRRSTFDEAGFRFTFDPATYEPFEETAHHEDHGVAPFWERSDARAITFDVPRTTISGPGVHVTGWGAHAPSYPRASEPRGLLREIDERFGPHPAFENEYACGWHDPRRLDRLTGALEIGAARRAEISRYLMQRFDDWELFVTVMSEAHSAAEMMWHGVDRDHPLADFDPDVRTRLVRVFVAIDRAVETILGGLGPDDTFILFALDGMRSSHGDIPSIVLLPELMHRQEVGAPLLRDPDQAAWRRAGCPPVVPRRGTTWRRDLDRRLVTSPHTSWKDRVQRSHAYETLRDTRAGRTLVERVKGTRLGVLGVEIPEETDLEPETIERSRDRADELLFIGNYRPYWPRMRSFALPTFGDGYLRLNIRGRERDGTISIEQYDEERRSLDALLGACRNPRTGHPVTDGIEWFEACTALTPEHRVYADGIVHWTEPIDAFDHPELGTVGPFPLHRTGTHDDVGFVWAAGPGIVAGPREDRPVVDLVPTILRRLDPVATAPPSGELIPISG
ncbi:MAG: hypothetical protein ACXVJ7_09115 [Acidimicrobiia bacterium]